MKSIHPVSPRIATTLALFALLIAVPAFAQAQAFTVTVQRNGQAVTPFQVVLQASLDPKAGSLAGNVARLEADVINASLEGKQATVFVDECEDGRVGVVLVPDGVTAPASANNCRRRRVGVAIILRGSRIVVDVGRGTVADASNATSSTGLIAGGGRRLGIGVFGIASGAWGGFNLGEKASNEITNRFTTANYQQYNVDIDDSASGLSFGGGLKLALRGSKLGALIGVVREDQRNVPRQSVNGTRTLGGLQFQQNGSAEAGSWMVYAGPTWTLLGDITFFGGPTLTFWNLVLNQQGQLQAGCPNPCAVVRTDNNTERSSGSDVGFHVGAEYYPGGSWLGMTFMYALTTYHDASDPTRALGYPTNWGGRKVAVGMVVRLPGRPE